MFARLILALFGLAAPALGQSDKPEGPIDFQSVIHGNDLEDVGSFRGTPTYDHARSVARMENLSGDGFCTGFRVGQRLFLTNYHCWEAHHCSVLFHLGYERGMPQGRQAWLRCTEVVDQFERLDFALYRVENYRFADDQDYPPATLTTKTLVLDAPLILPGHPVASPKAVDASVDCRLTLAVPYMHEGRESIQHQCDTEGGSSGAPLMDRENGHVVGIHWGGTDDTLSNHAIPISLILQYLAAAQPAAYAELTVAGD